MNETPAAEDLEHVKPIMDDSPLDDSPIDLAISMAKRFCCAPKVIIKSKIMVWNKNMDLKIIKYASLQV